MPWERGGGGGGGVGETGGGGSGARQTRSRHSRSTRGAGEREAFLYLFLLRKRGERLFAQELSNGSLSLALAALLVWHVRHETPSGGESESE